MTGRLWITCGAALAGLGVAAGALGAHGLKEVLSADRLHDFETAVRYQMYHAFGLIAAGLLVGRGCPRAIRGAGTLFVLGILLFSGGLYGWIFTEIKPLVHIVPIGGLAWILGWISLACAAWCGPGTPQVIETIEMPPMRH